MKHTVEVKKIDEDRIQVLGVEYYKADYLKEMMRREYQRGIGDGREIIIHKIEPM